MYRLKSIARWSGLGKPPVKDRDKTRLDRWSEAQNGLRDEIIKVGIIRSILTIGEDMYAIVQEAGDSRVDIDPSGPTPPKLFGFRGDDSGDALLPEVLIPVDRSAKAVDGIPQDLIGKQVDVVFAGGGKYPSYVRLSNSINGVRGQPFSVSTEHILRARAHGDGDINSEKATEILTFYGYNEEEIAGLRDMQLNELGQWEGSFINFSKDAPNPWTTHQSNANEGITLPEESKNLLLHPPSGRLKRRNCYLPPKAFTGKG